MATVFSTFRTIEQFAGCALGVAICAALILRYASERTRIWLGRKTLSFGGPTQFVWRLLVASIVLTSVTTLLSSPLEEQSSFIVGLSYAIIVLGVGALFLPDGESGLNVQILRPKLRRDCPNLGLWPDHPTNHGRCRDELRVRVCDIVFSRGA